VFTTGDAERMRIDASGNLLVGKSATGTGTVGAELRANGFNAFVRDGGEVMNINRLSSDGTIVDFRKDSSTVGSIGTTGGDLAVGTGDSGVRFRDEFDCIQPHNISSNGSTNGVLSLGKQGAAFKDLHLSGAAKTDTIANESSGTTTTSTTQTAIATFAKADYDSAKVVISAKAGTDVYSTELLIVHNGTTASATEYGQIGTGSALATFDVDISGSNVRVLATAASSTSTVFKVTKTLL
jgi:hypothetical protein